MKKNILALFFCFILIITDQITKHFASLKLMGHQDKKIIGDYLVFHYLENRGAAFGILNNQRIFFIILTLVFSLIFVIFYYKMPKTNRFFPLRLLLIVVFGGAMGNFIDRIHSGYVIDFIYVKFINFPVFNVADIYITCSCFLVAFLFLFYYKDEDWNEISQGFKPQKNS